ncbi:MAG: LptF/LptG family permease [Fimbriiglobus sp.]|jgi:lipopolysaccharide export system permease protein|nr:LptF/LptG family permease [Fimbriiglobus sp.]
MTTLDRMFFASYLRNFAIVLTCLLSLYLVVDLFMNLNDFTKGKNGPFDILSHVAGYYVAQIALIYDRLAELITLAAAVFTAAWMQRNNELLPQLSAGVPTRRVIRPIVFGAVLTTCLAPLNTEFYIPSVAEQLTVPRDEWKGKQSGPAKEIAVRGAYDQGGDFIDGAKAIRPAPRSANATPQDGRYGRVLGFEFTAAPGGDLTHLTAREAHYIPPGEVGEKHTGGWKLYTAKPERPSSDNLPANVTHLGPGQYFVRTGELDFDTVVRGRATFTYASTPELWEILNHGTSQKQPMAVAFHQRLVRPLNGLILAVFGLAVILKDQNRHVFISTGLCLILAVLFSALVFWAKYMGDQDILPAPLAAWIPALVFGPLCFATFDAIHT